MRQQTIAEKVSCTGIGLHSGAPVQLTLLPARADAGVVFARADLAGAPDIRFRAEQSCNTTLCRDYGLNQSAI